MPDPGQKPDDKKVVQCTPLTVSGSSQRNVNVVSEPAAEGDMPPTPKLGHCTRHIWIIKILKKVKTQHPPKADGHIRVTGEIIVYLKCIGDGADPCGRKS